VPMAAKAICSETRMCPPLGLDQIVTGHYL
jgi:hypothetical protein